MSRVLKRLAGGGTGGAFVAGDHLYLTPHVQPLKDDLDLLMLTTLCRNVYGGGTDALGIDGSASGDVDLLNWTPFVLDNTANQVSTFSDANSATLVAQCRFLLRVSNAAINITPKILYGTTITAVTSVATISGTAACSAAAVDFSGSNQYQTVTFTIPSGVNIFKPQVTIAGTPASGYMVFARAYWDVYIQS